MLSTISGVASHYNNCCIDGSTNPRNYTYPFMNFKFLLFGVFQDLNFRYVSLPKKEISEDNKKYK
jgi:hypothetical protein